MVHRGTATPHRGSAAWAHRRNARRSGRTGSAAPPARRRGCASVLPSRSPARRRCRTGRGRHPATCRARRRAHTATAPAAARSIAAARKARSSCAVPAVHRRGCPAPTRWPPSRRGRRSRLHAAGGLPPIRPPRCGSPRRRCGRAAGRRYRHPRPGRSARRPGREWWHASSAPCRRRRCASRSSGGTASPGWQAAPTYPCRSVRRRAYGPRRRCASPAGTASRHRCG